ncbi:hypothetical protein GCM10010441_77990 [Kitasatospora paracochleata]|uniref:Uncharacterized protein n=1 Tax=Kitasatospora paracochleata TaxID=58354 RepID=A0ABT1IYF2_9ACTN|nr:hypothetical protein [Kitasatospora paracochleata]MCP2309974.1 hypothetical protein [Kitasatospora paracochleata]
MSRSRLVRAAAAVLAGLALAGAAQSTAQAAARTTARTAAPAAVDAPRTAPASAMVHPSVPGLPGDYIWQ